MKPDVDGTEDLDGLARAASQGDAEAFERLVRLVYARIHRWALVRVGDVDDADDVTQTVLVRLHAGLSEWEGRGRFTTWLYRVTANEASTWGRRITRRARWMVRAPDAREERVDGRIGPGAELERDEMVQLLQAFFRTLPPRQREVFDLVEYQGYTPAEVGEMLDMNPSTVRANLFKARRTIRDRVARESREAAE